MGPWAPWGAMKQSIQPYGPHRAMEQQNIKDFLGGAAFSENVLSPKGWPTNLQKWVCLAGKISVSLPPVFRLILDPPNAHIRQNPKSDRE